MKKLLVLVGLMVALSPSVISAQTLTKAEVETVRPQLVNLLASISTTVPNVVSAKIAEQNSVLKNYSAVLGGMSLKLSSPNPPSSEELVSMGKIISGFQTEVSAIAKWRADANVAMANISKILANISNILASAV